MVFEIAGKAMACAVITIFEDLEALRCVPDIDKSLFPQVSNRYWHVHAGGHDPIRLYSAVHPAASASAKDHTEIFAESSSHFCSKVA
jgi:hypothetical protein